MGSTPSVPEFQSVCRAQTGHVGRKQRVSIAVKRGSCQNRRTGTDCILLSVGQFRSHKVPRIVRHQNGPNAKEKVS